LTYFVDTLNYFIKMLSIGLRNRSKAETAMNRQSSRSHAVFQLQVEYTETTTTAARTPDRTPGAGAGAGEVLVKRTSKFRLIDLAGSERQKDTSSTSIRLKEAALINKSLSTLGRVINALVEAGNSGGASGAYIPYRDSKLTFLLRDALGGNSKTTLIATVSPAAGCAFDSLSTLRFVHRAKCIRNAVIMNEQCFESVSELKSEIAALKEYLEAERSKNHRLTVVLASLSSQPPLPLPLPPPPSDLSLGDLHGCRGVGSHTDADADADVNTVDDDDADADDDVDADSYADVYDYADADATADADIDADADADAGPVCCLCRNAITGSQCQHTDAGTNTSPAASPAGSPVCDVGDSAQITNFDSGTQTSVPNTPAAAACIAERSSIIHSAASAASAASCRGDLLSPVHNSLLSSSVCSASPARSPLQLQLLNTGKDTCACRVFIFEYDGYTIVGC
jgi:hypothetical protein